MAELRPASSSMIKTVLGSGGFMAGGGQARDQSLGPGRRTGNCVCGNSALAPTAVGANQGEALLEGPAGGQAILGRVQAPIDELVDGGAGHVAPGVRAGIVDQ